MRNLFALTAFAALPFLLCLPVHAQLKTYGPGAGGNIPDAIDIPGVTPVSPAEAIAGISSTITVPDNFTIDSFKSVTVTGLVHNWAGDLIISLIHDDVSVAIINRILGGGTETFGDESNFGGTYTFELGGADIDAVAAGLGNGGVIPSATYAPYAGGNVTGGSPGGSSSSTQTLDDFAGKNVQGIWTLNISDRVEGADGSFTGWSFGVNQLVLPATAAPEPISLSLLSIGVPMALISRRRKVSERCQLS